MPQIFLFRISEHFPPFLSFALVTILYGTENSAGACNFQFQTIV